MVIRYRMCRFMPTIFMQEGSFLFAILSLSDDGTSLMLVGVDADQSHSLSDVWSHFRDNPLDIATLIVPTINVLLEPMEIYETSEDVDESEAMIGLFRQRCPALGEPRWFAISYPNDYWTRSTD